MASRNFVNTFKRWQLIGKRKEVQDSRYGNETFVYYGNELAEEGCTQVAIVTLDEVEAERNIPGGNGQMNYKDSHNDYEYSSCLTRCKNYNYAIISCLKRELYTKEAFEILRKFNEAETSDWGDDYRPFVEEVMNLTGAVYRLMYKYLDGAHTMHAYPVMYQHKLDRMVDARDNLEKRKHYDLQMMGVFQMMIKR